MSLHIAIAEGQLERAVAELAGIAGGVGTAAARSINRTLAHRAATANRKAGL